MTKQISPKDWQTLSEYLDGQLSNRERVQIEARLQTSDDLRSGLEEIKRTRTILRTLPKRRAPRNFTLTPAMVPQKRIAPPRVFPYLRLASALASVLLVITFLSDFAIHNGPFAATSGANAPAPQAPAAIQSAPNPYPLPPAAAAPAATQAPSATEAPAAPANAARAAEAPTASPTQEELHAYAAKAPTEDATQQASAAMTAAPRGLGAGPNPADTAPAAGSAPLQNAAPLETPAPKIAQDQSSESNPAPDTFGPAQTGPSQNVNPGEEAPQAISAQKLPFEISSLLRLAEILFAVIAVLTGLAAYIVYRAGRT